MGLETSLLVPLLPLQAEKKSLSQRGSKSAIRPFLDVIATSPACQPINSQAKA